MSFNEGETITIHNTDNDTTAKATIVDFKGDFLIEIGTDNSHWDIHYMMRF